MGAQPELKNAPDKANGETAGLLEPSVMGAQPELKTAPDKANDDTARLLEPSVMVAQPELKKAPDKATDVPANSDSANDDTAGQLEHSTAFKDRASMRRTTTAELKITPLRFLSGGYGLRRYCSLVSKGSLPRRCEAVRWSSWTSCGTSGNSCNAQLYRSGNSSNAKLRGAHRRVGFSCTPGVLGFPTVRP